jgi:hypothetical protein
LDLLQNDVPEDFAQIQIHISDGSLTKPWCGQRASFYGVTGTPDTFFDGVLEASGAYTNVQQMYTWYLGQINQRKAVATDVTIELGGAQVSGSTWQITANVCLETGGIPKTVRVYIVSVLDNHPSPAPTYSHNTFMLAAPTTDVALTAGDCQVVQHNITFDSLSWANQNDIKIIAWAQAPFSSSPAEVYQTAIMEWPFIIDCNGNGIPDACDIDCGPTGGSCDVPGCGQSSDCNTNGVPDECEPGGLEDCNTNSVVDLCDIAAGTSLDCNYNAIPDECEVALLDCNTNGVPDDCDVSYGTSPDCNFNMVPDECELGANDCNTNSIPDDCDIYYGTSLDCNANGTPDECEVALLDCNTNGVPDDCDVMEGTSPDCNYNVIPDECDIAAGAPDCNTNGVPDDCDLVAIMIYDSGQLSPIGLGNPQTYTIMNPPPSTMDVTLDYEAFGDFSWSTESVDIYLNNVYIGWIFVQGALDCQVATDQQVIPMADWNAAAATGQIEIKMIASPQVDPNFCAPDPSYIQVVATYQADAISGDCNTNGIPDECDIASGFSQDLNNNGIPDECESGWCLGDANCSGGAPDFTDIQFFVAALTNEQAWNDYHMAQTGSAPACPYLVNDMNGGGVTFTDIQPFVQALGQPCQPF